jgi:hypothetical protein
MASHWLWVLILGVVVAAGGVAASRLLKGWLAPRPLPSFPAVLLGILLAAVALALSLPSKHPFSPGNEMAYGVLLGIGAAVLALVALRLSRPTEEHKSQVAAAAGLGGIALILVAVTESVFAGDPAYALAGAAAAVLLVLMPSLWLRRGDEDAGWQMEFLGLAVVALAFAALLAIYRYDTHVLRPYWALPAVALAAGLLGAVVGVFCLGSARGHRWATFVIALAVALGIWYGGAYLLGRVYGLEVPRELTIALGMGWLVFGLASIELGGSSDRLAIRLAVPLLAVVLFAIGFNLGGAYGVSLSLAGGMSLGLPLAAWPTRRERASPLLWLAASGVLYLAYRLFIESFASEFRAYIRLDIARHYVLVGLAAGIVWAAAAWLQRSRRWAAAAQWLTLAALPVVLFLVFGHQALLGLVVGLLIAQLFLPALDAREGESPAAPYVFFPLAAVWALIIPNWAHFMLQLPRSTRGIIIGVAAGAAVLLLSLLRERRQPDPETRSAAGF